MVAYVYTHVSALVCVYICGLAPVYMYELLYLFILSKYVINIFVYYGSHQ